MHTVLVALFLLAVSAPSAFAPAFPQAPAPQQSRPGDPSPGERTLLDAVNKERVTRRLRPLKWDPALARAARAHAELMARNNAISHQFPGEPGLSVRASSAGARFRLIEENVGVASNVLELHDLWMKSTAHRDNLLNAQVDHAGFALVDGSEGRLFGVEDFAKLTPKLTLDEQERRVEGLLAAKGLRVDKAAASLRKTCELDRGVAPGDHPKYLLRYIAADLDALPEELVAEVDKGGYEAAAVGACESDENATFAQYRIAVELF